MHTPMFDNNYYAYIYIAFEIKFIVTSSKRIKCNL